MFSNAIATLQQAIYRRGIHYSLDRLYEPLARLNNPHTTLPPVIHVAGTNGKGSTVTFIASALSSVGLTVGTYTSPHILSYRERIAINGIPISEPDFCHYLDLASQASGPDLSSEFELLTLMALRYFSDKAPDIIIIETGLGGRLDATNVITPILTVLTPIGLDHQDILGESIQEIAHEKAGIIKPGIPVISALQSPEVSQVLTNEAHRISSPITFITPWDQIPDHFRLRADYQRQNVAVAEASAKQALAHINRLPKNILAGLAKASIWGRYNQYRHHNAIITVDGAHNSHGFNALFNSHPHPTTLWMGMLCTKSLTDAVRYIPDSVQAIYLYCPDPDRWHSPDTLQPLTSTPIYDGSNTTLFPPHTTDLLITGSLYFIATVHPLFDTLTPL